MSTFERLGHDIASRGSIASRRYQGAVESVGADVASLPIESIRRVESEGIDAVDREGNSMTATTMEAKIIEPLSAVRTLERSIMRRTPYQRVD